MEIAPSEAPQFTVLGREEEEEEEEERCKKVWGELYEVEQKRGRDAKMR